MRLPCPAPPRPAPPRPAPPHRSYEVARFLRAQYPHLLLPIIMVSANKLEEHVVEGLQVCVRGGAGPCGRDLGAARKGCACSSRRALQLWAMRCWCAGEGAEG